jgi:hypothetical protein
MRDSSTKAENHPSGLDRCLPVKAFLSVATICFFALPCLLKRYVLEEHGQGRWGYFVGLSSGCDASTGHCCEIWAALFCSCGCVSIHPFVGTRQSLRLPLKSMSLTPMIVVRPFHRRCVVPISRTLLAESMCHLELTRRGEGWADFGQPSQRNTQDYCFMNRLSLLTSMAGSPDLTANDCFLGYLGMPLRDQPASAASAACAV